MDPVTESLPGSLQEPYNSLDQDLKAVVDMIDQLKS